MALNLARVLSMDRMTERALPYRFLLRQRQVSTGAWTTVSSSSTAAPSAEVLNVLIS